MSTIAASPPRLYTPDDLLEMPDGDRYELVDGRLVELNMSAKSSLVAGNVTHLLMSHCKPIGLAIVFPEQGYICFPGKPNRMRKPDVSCVRPDRLTPEQLDEGYLSIPPDLAVEVVSPNDRAVDLEEKLDDYRDAGIPLVWIIYPPRKVRILRPGRPPVDLGPDDELTGEDILPGFRCRVADLFDGLPAPQAGPPG
jgi:Uma2 family endonuclease